MTATDQLRDAVVAGQATQAAALSSIALEQGEQADTLLADGLMAAMREVGRRFEVGEYYVPEMLLSAHAMKAALEILRPHLIGGEARANGRVAIGTVTGDLHDIGKNLVAMMLQGSGYEVEDLGIDVYPERFVEAARDGAEVIAISALLTTTMTNMPQVIQALTSAGLRERVRIIVGGAPLTQEYCDAIGADGYAKSAAGAVRLVEGMLSAPTH